MSNIKWVLLEIKVATDVEVGPKVFENIFAGLHGTMLPVRWKGKFFKGEIVDYFSFEIVGRAGEISFFVRVPEDSRNFVEALLFSQYPDAEINEVEDYVNDLPEKLPNDKYDLWGGELKLVKEDIYPIKTYVEFGGEDFAIDPLSAFSEVLAKLKTGEQIWLQFIIQPTGKEVGDDWMKEAEGVVADLMGRKKKENAPRFNIGPKIVDIIDKAITNAPVKEKEKEGLKFIDPRTPLETETAKAISRSVTKLGFRTGIRFIYVANREVYNRSHIGGIIGSFKQFASGHLNSFKPGFLTYSRGIFSGPFPSDKGFNINKIVGARKRKLYEAARLRSLPIVKPFVLNTEELATLYHFPDKSTLSPRLPRIESKRGEAPPTLPSQ